MEANLPFDAESFVRCPRCERPELTSRDFGVCRARPSGKNLYCFCCIREKIAASRLALKEYKKARVANGLDPKRAKPSAQPLFSSRRIARMLRKLSPEDRVREAIKHGAHTQKEIARVTKLPKDEVTDCIATLLLWSRDIRTRVIRHQRLYFVNETPGLVIRSEPVRPEREPRSFGVSTIYDAGEPEIRGMSTRYLRNKVG